MSGLDISEKPITSLAEVRPGDAVIGFSRRELYVLKQEIEATTGLKACVVYGALPPEVRRQQVSELSMVEMLAVVLPRHLGLFVLPVKLNGTFFLLHSSAIHTCAYRPAFSTRGRKVVGLSSWQRTQSAWGST